MKPNRIKLLKFVTLFEIGGTERQVVNLAKNLDRARFDVNMACLQRSGPFLKELEELNIPVVEYSMSSLRSRGAVRQALRCARQIRRDGIEIVHTYGFYPNAFAVPAAKLGGAKVVIASIRDMGDISSPLHRRVQRFICHWADCVLVNAEAIRLKLKEVGYNDDKIQVIKNGIDLARFRPRTATGKFHHELGLPPTTPLVVLLSRLSKFKGVEYFLEAAAIVARQIDNVRFVIVGGLYDDPAYNAALKNQAARLGLERRVIFTGFRLDVPELLAETAVSVLPTLSEGLSNTLIESMAAGVPIVATEVGGNPEIVAHGKTGLLVPPRDAQALARDIALLLTNPETARRFGAAGKERAARYFSIGRMVRETENLYFNLLDRPRMKNVVPAESIKHDRRELEETGSIL
jgi:glycosyltransferase involved in cell wall biosynthesis